MEMSPKMQVELFHLMFLRQLSNQIAANLYAVKGDCNLRFFFGSIHRNICQPYHLGPFRISHYGSAEAFQQKIMALANRSLTQARDIFDLYHLLHVTVPSQLIMPPPILEKAQEALLSIHFEDYKSQVVSFLEPEHQTVHDSKNYWKTISTEVLHYLEGLKQ